MVGAAADLEFSYFFKKTLHLYLCSLSSLCVRVCVRARVCMHACACVCMRVCTRALLSWFPFPAAQRGAAAPQFSLPRCGRHLVPSQPAFRPQLVVTLAFLSSSQQTSPSPSSSPPTSRPKILPVARLVLSSAVLNLRGTRDRCP